MDMKSLGAENLYRASAFFKHFSRAAITASKSKDILDALCRLSVERLGYAASWAGFCIDLEDKRIVLSSFSGLPSSYFDLFDLCICCDNPAGEAALKGEPFVLNDISTADNISLWKEKAIEFGFQSACAIPIKSFEKVIAVFCVISSDKNRFCLDEVELLSEIANEVGLCINLLLSNGRNTIKVFNNTDVVEKFSVLFQNTSDAVFIHKMQNNETLIGNFIEVNKVACEKLGYSHEEFKKLSFDTICKSKDFTHTFSLLKTGQTRGDTTFIAKNGDIVHMRFSGHSFCIEGESFTILIARDIREKLRTAKQLNLLRNAVENNIVSVIITDKEGVIEYVNHSFEKFSGYSIDEVIGKKPNFLNSGQTNKKLFSELWETISEGKIWRGELCNKKKNGELYWEFAIIFPVFDHAGEITNYIGMKEDITDRRFLEEQLRHSQRLSIIGEMAGSFTHDLKNIILVIGGFANRLYNKLEPNSTEQEYALHIMKAVKKAAKLTNGLLTFGRKQPNNMVHADLNLLLGEYYDLVENIVGKKVHISLNLIDENIPIRADIVQIEQVLINLASNAKDAMDGSGHLSITSFIKDDYAHMTFSDTGSGMDKTTLGRLFDPFYTTKDPGKGTGLGLSIVYGIIRQHGGLITCRSEEGKGATFEILLPLNKPTQKL